jgi:hypothetical protein
VSLSEYSGLMELSLMSSTESEFVTYPRYIDIGLAQSCLFSCNLFPSCDTYRDGMLSLIILEL